MRPLILLIALLAAGPAQAQHCGEAGTIAVFGDSTCFWEPSKPNWPLMLAPLCAPLVVRADCRPGRGANLKGLGTEVPVLDQLQSFLDGVPTASACLINLGINDVSAPGETIDRIVGGLKAMGDECVRRNMAPVLVTTLPVGDGFFPGRAGRAAELRNRTLALGSQSNWRTIDLFSAFTQKDFETRCTEGDATHPWTTECRQAIADFLARQLRR